jgi:zinc protease
MVSCWRCVRPALGRALVLGLCHAFVIPASPVWAQRTPLAGAMRDTVLDNGLQVIVVRNPTVPLATIQVTVRNGAFTQLEAHQEGMPHMLEHMLFRAFNGGRGFGGSANDLDAAYNGTTSDETVTYYITVPSQHFDRGVRLMAELMREPRFRDSELVPEKQVVRGELERAASDPNFLLRQSVDQRLWGDGFVRKNAIGNMPTILGSTAPALKEMYDRYYVPNNAALVITGDVQEGAAFASAARHFSRWRRGADPFAGLVIPPQPPLAAHGQVIVQHESSDITLLIRWHGPSVRDDAPATYAADLFSALVNDATSGLQERLVDSGLFQSVSMSYHTLVHTGPITLRAVTTEERVDEATAALLAEIERFSEPAYVTEEALAIARKREEVDWAMRMESPSQMAWFIGELWSVAGLEYARGYVDALSAQQVPDLEAYVARYIAGRPRVLGVLLAPSARSRLGLRLNAALEPWR